MRLALTALLLLMSCAKSQPISPPAPAATAPDGPRVVFPDGYVVRVEIAANPEMRAQGLMFRDQLRADAGMLFFFPEEGEHSFWMKNTRIPLDMIWLDAERRIVHIEHDVPPCHVEECPSYPAGAPSSYVLEVAGGVARQHGLEKGDRLQFAGVEHVVVE